MNSQTVADNPLLVPLIIVFLAFLVVSVNLFSQFELTRRSKEQMQILKIQAVDQGYGDWVVDKNGVAVFNWKTK